MKAKVKYPTLKKEEKKNTGKKVAPSVNAANAANAGPIANGDTSADVPVGVSASKPQEVSDDCDVREDIKNQANEENLIISQKGKSPSS